MATNVQFQKLLGAICQLSVKILALRQFMQVHIDVNSLPVFQHAVVTIGTFDGVHLGHRQIIRQLKEEAALIQGETVIITFHPHPRKIVREGQSPVPILSTLSEKIALLEAEGIDHLVVVPFDETFAAQTAAEYVQYFLVEKFHPHTVIIGYDHRFGKGRAGDYHLLEAYGLQLGFMVKEIPEHILDEVTISSTRIREALLQTDIDTANHFLGYSYFFEGIVVKGNQLGRTIGFATANLQVEDAEKLIPGNGVYAVTVSLAGETFNGMMNIGLRPTVDGTKRVIEVHLLDFNRDIYGQLIKVTVQHYLRGEVKFSGLDALKEQLAKDKLAASAILNRQS